MRPRARHELARRLSKMTIPQRQDLADWIGVTLRTVHNWRAGRVIPSSRHRQKLERWMRMKRTAFGPPPKLSPVSMARDFAYWQLANTSPCPSTVIEAYHIQLQNIRFRMDRDGNPRPYRRDEKGD